MKQALILIDLQNDYFPGGKMELAGSEEAVENAAKALALWRSRNLEVIHVQHIAAQEGSTFFLPDTTGAEIHNTVAPQKGEVVIVKHFPNSFRQTELLQILQEKGVDHLVVCGAMSHMCVDATVRAAFDFGLQCTVVHDACATREQAFEDRVVSAADVHASFMAALSAVYAETVSFSDLK